MKKYGLAVAAVSLLGVLHMAPAAATPSPISITLQSGSTTTVTEGNTITLTFDVADTDPNSADTYIGRGDGQGSGITYISGDVNDKITDLSGNFTFPAGCSTLSIGGSCSFSLTWNTSTGAGDTDHDSGVYSVDPSLTFQLGSNPAISVDALTLITVQDAPASVTSVPEPGSLALLGGGLAALGVMRRKRKAS